ncbi:uncharacterized protein RCC_09564 [Ramularia collo-cygni]|uniref:Uncharacterized protein n=1 Tax=Ramularia collo-cygni TaxID=112498 RepID=A0A2D3VKC9_9PEZI|nr:uncharacterized protein RCC_09564 [Ramularia collo-cygni]CZT23849.1 uncharacterized protein RCC_09564 [Ramularia collo-cygni]
MASAIGVISGLITIFLFARDELGQDDPPNAVLNFKVGLDGTNPPAGIDGGPLTDAGGNIPDVRLWNENGGFIGITTNDNNNCGSGADVCETKVSDVEQQPTYTLLTGNNDAICLSWAAITFPGGQQYGCPLGNWAQECANNHGGEATWYWSNIFLELEEGGEAPVPCAWVDADGDMPTTGIQIHWPDFSPGTAGDVGTSFYCANNFALRFRFDEDPSTVIRPARRSLEPYENKQYTRLRKRFEKDSRLVKSSVAQHSASELCNAPTSVGPSFVSYAERAFCYMPTKTVYPFCEEDSAGACWSDDDDLVVVKGDARIENVPAMTFNQTLSW